MSTLYTSGHKVKYVNIRHKGFILVAKNVQINVDSPVLYFRCIDGILALNNSKFIDFFDRIYFPELELTDTTNTARSTS
jgi:hypothetical protein